MTSRDVQGILDDLPVVAGARPPKKSRPIGRPANLKGLQREVQSLGGDNPIAIVPVVPQFKKRRVISRKPATKWEQAPFGNSARTDGLLLKHWRRKKEVLPPAVGDVGDEDVKMQDAEPVIDDSAFAKYNVEVNTPTYTDEQYESMLQSETWTKEETEYLMSVVKDFDLRWPIIWDRYEYTPSASTDELSEGDAQALVKQSSPRTMEDLKLRYYKVAAKMMEDNHPVQYMTAAEFNLHSLMKSYDAEQEQTRKRFAENILARSTEERMEEESLLIELKRIMARADRLNEERKELYARLDSPISAHSQTYLGQYTTSSGLQQLCQQLSMQDKSRKRKSIMPDGANTSTPTTAGNAPPQKESTDRRDSIRESISAVTNKKTTGPAVPAERRTLSREEAIVYGVSYHERLTGGPVFRHERPNKLLTNGKSQALQNKITNTLDVLKVPQRLVMPTGEVVATYERLLDAIGKLLDVKKVTERLDGEILVLEASIAERQGTKDIEAESTTDQNGIKEDQGAAQENREPKAESVPPPDDDKTESTTIARAHSISNKRSASVLSQASEQSSKRQRK